MTIFPNSSKIIFCYLYTCIQCLFSDISSAIFSHLSIQMYIAEALVSILAKLKNNTETPEKNVGFPTKDTQTAPQTTGQYTHVTIY